MTDHKCEWKFTRDLFKYEDLKEILGNIREAMAQIQSYEILLRMNLCSIRFGYFMGSEESISKFFYLYTLIS